LVKGVEALMELASGGFQRGTAIVGKGTADGTTVASDNLGFRVRALFKLPFAWSHPADARFQFFFGVPLGVVDGLGSFAEIMEMTQWMGNPGAGLLDGVSDGVLAITDDTHNGDLQSLLDLVDESGQIVSG
jgi:hypothetical protein